MIKITDRSSFIERCFNASRCSARGAELWTWVNEMIDSMTESGREEDGLMSRLEGFACDDPVSYTHLTLPTTSRV